MLHETCEQHCADCGRCDWELSGPATFRVVPMTLIDGRPVCADCIPAEVDR